MAPLTGRGQADLLMSRMLRFGSVLVLAFGLVLLLTQEATAVSAARLGRIHRALKDPDLRVRVQALIVLARFKDRRSVAPIVRVLLHDRSVSCRSLAAAALGAIGDPWAVAPLKRRRSDPSSRVRRQVRLALLRLAKLRPSSARQRFGTKKNARVWLRLGSMGARTRAAKRLRRRLRAVWERQVIKTKGIGLLRRGKHQKGHQKVFKVNSSITRFSRVRAGPVVRTTCMVSVVLDHGGSIVMMTSGGATVEVPASRFRRSDVARVDRSVLETAVASAHGNLVRYLRRY